MKNNLDFTNCKVLIVGDIMLDKYYFGKVERISPEAPVPVVNIKKEETRLGGASNVAHNISSLGGQVLLYGAIGHDFFGKEIERMARQKNIGTVLVKNSFPTITKARIIGGKQQIVRLDFEEKISLSPKEEEALKESIAAVLGQYDILIVSDYGKGLISESLCQFLITLARENQLPVIIDPKGKNWNKYTGAALITPNVKELSDIVGYSVDNEDSAIEAAARDILGLYHLTSLLVTRSEKGMSLITPGESIHIPTHAEEVFDVSGAGDTVIATLSICLANGMNIQEAMQVANVAAGIVVKKIGTATLSCEELRKNLK
ncbi:MAG: D-glycero-beta-D-manno-heptose-7-phosphate kinase [Oscillibacter sp.]|nr:D-glycero-beta-D-manno-heptose-7-phosphate kinase [Oscillibacter sp.]